MAFDCLGTASSTAHTSTSLVIESSSQSPKSSADECVTTDREGVQRTLLIPILCLPRAQKLVTTKNGEVSLAKSNVQFPWERMLWPTIRKTMYKF